MSEQFQADLATLIPSFRRIVSASGRLIGSARALVVEHTVLESTPFIHDYLIPIKSLLLEAESVKKEVRHQLAPVQDRLRDMVLAQDDHQMVRRVAVKIFEQCSEQEIASAKRKCLWDTLNQKILAANKLSFQDLTETLVDQFIVHLDDNHKVLSKMVSAVEEG